jgi:beta-lactamase regulating signal transducer with metallopeptidase domain
MSIINVLGESAVRSLALALAVAIVLRVLRVQHARLAKRAWTAVLILALAMPALVALHIPSFSFTALWSTPRTIIVSVPPPSIAAANAVSLDAVDSTTVVTQTPALPENLAPAVRLNVPVPAALQGPPQGPRQNAPVPGRHIAWWQIGFIAYLVITALLLFRVFLGLVLALRLWRRAQSFATSETDLPVRLSMDLRSPATVGHGILLPLEAIEWDDAALRATLAHEAEHIREGDFYLQLAATLHHCFFWISPHAWWLRPQLSLLSETICDRAAVASSGDGLSYAQLLLRFATAEQTPAGVVAMAQSAGLRERIERLIADPELTGAFRHRRGQAMVAAVLFATVAIITAATVHFVQPATIVLAAPQAPAAPAAPTSAAPAPAAAPDTTSDPAALDAGSIPALPATPSPDVAPAAASGTGAPAGAGEGIGQGVGIGADSSRRTVVRVMPVVPRMRVETDVAPEVFAIQQPDLVAPAVSVVGALALLRPPAVRAMRMKVLAMPQVNVVQAGDDDVVDLDGRGTAICVPSGQNASAQCSLNGHTIKTGPGNHPGGAILFERDGKTYVIDDPALVKQAQEAYSHVRELGKQQGELGAKQGKLGAQQGELGALQGQLGAMQGQLGAMDFNLNGSDFNFEMPKDFDKSVRVYTDSTTRLALDRELSEQMRAQLEAEQKEARANFDKAMAEWKAQEPQRQAMEKQIREQAEKIRKQMEPLMQQMRELGAKQGELGRLQGELGRQQALLGMQQQEAAREADSKVHSLVDQAMRDGKARPAQ